MDKRTKIEQLIATHIVGHPIEVIVGYGGVLFLEIGEVLKPRVTRGQGQYYRQMYFFVDEIWTIEYRGKKMVARFGPESNQVLEKYLQEINRKLITSFAIEPTLENTIITIGDYRLIIKQTEALTTWDFYHRIQGFNITLTGRKELKQQTYTFEKPRKMSALRPRKKTEFDSFYRENLPTSQSNAEKLLLPLVGFVVSDIQENSAISFTLRSQDEHLAISIDSDWQLIRQGRQVLTSIADRFYFVEKLKKHLSGKKITATSLNKSDYSLIIEFTGGLTLKVKKSQRYTWWTVFNSQKGYHISAMGEGKFEHIIICPDDLKDKYLETKYGSAAANCLYALDLYRELMV